MQTAATYRVPSYSSNVMSIDAEEPEVLEPREGEAAAEKKRSGIGKRAGMDLYFWEGRQGRHRLPVYEVGQYHLSSGVLGCFRSMMLC